MCVRTHVNTHRCEQPGWVVGAASGGDCATQAAAAARWRAPPQQPGEHTAHCQRRMMGALPVAAPAAPPTCRVRVRLDTNTRPNLVLPARITAAAACACATPFGVNLACVWRGRVWRVVAAPRGRKRAQGCVKRHGAPQHSACSAAQPRTGRPALHAVRCGGGAVCHALQRHVHTRRVAASITTFHAHHPHPGATLSPHTNDPQVAAPTPRRVSTHTHTAYGAARHCQCRVATHRLSRWSQLRYASSPRHSKSTLCDAWPCRMRRRRGGQQLGEGVGRLQAQGTTPGTRQAHAGRSLAAPAHAHTHTGERVHACPSLTCPCRTKYTRLTRRSGYT